jgi:hypothetical protein
MRGISLFSSIAVIGNCITNASESEAAPQKHCSLLQVKTRSEGVKQVLELAANQVLARQNPTSFTRPGLKNGKVDKVEFGILVKRWYGIDFPAGTFTVDAIIASRWQDKRNSKLIPADASHVRMSSDDADAAMWLPDLAVTNIAHDGVDILSSSVLVEENGTNTRVQRALLTLKQGYQTADFPFDTQSVYIKLASTIYMSDEVKLVPTEDESLWGCSSELFGNTPWSIVNTSLSSLSEDDGLLQKSRGILTIVVAREVAQYRSSIFIPTIVLLSMSWCSLWLPVATPYVMPRVAVSVISILCMMSVMQKANVMIPATGATTWLTQYLETCVLLQFVLMVLNALILSIEHRSKGEDSLAKGLDNEIIVAFPILTFFVMCFVWIGFFLLARFSIALAMIGFIFYMFYRQRLKQHAEAS